ALGASVAIEGDTIAAGAPALWEPVRAAGAIYVFERDGAGAWRQTQRVQHDEPVDSDKLGISVAINDGVLFGGAHYHGYGAVFVFQRNGAGDWRQTNTLSPGLGGDFGASLAVGGGVVA